MKHYPQTNWVEWNLIGGIPYYKISDNEGHIAVINAGSNWAECHAVFSTKELQNIYSKQIGRHPFSLTLRKEYDNYYTPSQKQQCPLLVYRLTIDDEFKTTLYINPKTSELLPGIITIPASGAGYIIFSIPLIRIG